MKFFEDKDLKKITYLFISIIIIAVLVFGVIFLWYNNALTNETEFSSLNIIYSNSINNKINNTYNNENIASVSFSDDKDIANKVNLEENLNKDNEKIAVKIDIDENEKINSNDKLALDESEFEGNEIEPQEYKLVFEAPVSGEILKDFAEDTLTYSKTLDEWTTHLGLDIKAEKTSVVKASERGKIESIKNDPRYGLTIVITHEDGFKTIYSNLLTTEFVAIGDNVEKGQTIGTVGQSASFETLDESHLHFEMYKDGTPVNPTIYFK